MKTTGGRIHYAWYVLLMGVLAVACVLGFARFGYTIILPSMQKSLHLSNTQAGTLATANLLGYACFALLGRAASSRFGPRRVISTGLLIIGVSMLLTGLVHSFLSAAALRLLTGIGSGLGNVPAVSLAAAWFSAPRRGLAAGVISAGSSVGIILVGSVVPSILAVGPDGWRSAWYAYGATSLVAAVTVYAILRDRPADKGLLPLGESAPARPVAAPADPPAHGRPSGGLHWRRVYRSGSVWHLGVVYVAYGFSYFLYMTFFTKHLVTSAGYTTAAAGSLFMILGWFSLLSGILWGAISDRIGRKPALMIVYVWNAAAFALFALSHRPVGFLASAVLFGLSAWAVPSIIAAACGDVVGARLAPAALGLATFLFALGQSLGPAVAGMIADSTGGFAPAFLLAAAVSLLGAVAAAFLRPLPTRSTPLIVPATED